MLTECKAEERFARDIASLVLACADDASETLAIEDGLLALENSPKAIRTRIASALSLVLDNAISLCALQRRSEKAEAAALARTSEALEVLRRIASEKAEVELAAALERAVQVRERLAMEKAERREAQHAREQMELLQAEVAAELHAALEVDLAYFAEAEAKLQPKLEAEVQAVARWRAELREAARQRLNRQLAECETAELERRALDEAVACEQAEEDHSWRAQASALRIRETEVKIAAFLVESAARQQLELEVELRAAEELAAAVSADDLRREEAVFAADNFVEAPVGPLLRWLMSHSAAWAMGRMATAVVSAARASCNSAHRGRAATAVVRAARVSCNKNSESELQQRPPRASPSSKWRQRSSEQRERAATAPTEGEPIGQGSAPTEGDPQHVEQRECAAARASSENGRRASCNAARMASGAEPLTEALAQALARDGPRSSRHAPGSRHAPKDAPEAGWPWVPP